MVPFGANIRVAYRFIAFILSQASWRNFTRWLITSDKVQFYGIGVPLRRLTAEHGALTVEKRARLLRQGNRQISASRPDCRWPAGVIVALEMARQLKNRGREDVALVAIDLAPEIDAEMSRWTYALKLARNVPCWIKSEKITEREFRRELSKHALKKANRLMSKILGRTRSPLLEGRASLNLSEPHKRFIEAFFEKLENYDPKPCDGAVLAVVAGTEPLFHLELVEEKWAKIAKNLDVVCIKEATHRNLMSVPHVAKHRGKIRRMARNKFSAKQGRRSLALMSHDCGGVLRPICNHFSQSA
jgi:thioesterase domain-containing protein